MAEKKGNILLYIGIGCAGLVLLAGVAIVGLGYFGIKKAKEFEENIKNPGPKSLELLGVEQLPPEYNAQVALSIPFVMEMVIISNGQPRSENEKEDMGTEGLFYMKFAWGGEKNQELRDYFDGKTDDPSALREANINIDTTEIISRGVIELEDGKTINYLTQRGNMKMSGTNTRDGLNTMFLIQCENDQKMRFGFRYGPDPDPAMPADELDLTGTVADEEALGDFIGQFHFCK